MKYITNIEINNFQSHKNTRMDFINGLNVIVGPSDQGKTAIIRSIKWVLYNEPLGDFFIKHGENEASVILTFNTGEKVKRLRSSSKNLYIYISENGNEEIYEGFGTHTPIDIVEKLNIRKINLDNKESSSINIGEQLEGPFLISQKNSTKANAIGRLVGVHVVDKAVQNTIRDTRGHNIKKNSLSEDIDALELKSSQYDYLNSLENQIVKLETIEEAITYKENILTKLTGIRKKYNDNIKETKKYSDIASKLSEVNIIIRYLSDLDNMLHKIKRLNKLKNKLLEVNKSINTSNYVLNELENIHYIGDIIGNLEKKINVINNLMPKYSNYNLLINEIKKTEFINHKLNNINDSNDIYIKIENKSKLFNNLITYRKKIKKISSSIEKGKVYINKFKSIDKVMYLYDEIFTKQDRINSLSIFIAKLNKLNIEKEKSVSIINNENLSHKKLLEEYKKLLKTIEKCPLCFNEISNDDMERIINNLK